jgi:hypothetical protein
MLIEMTSHGRAGAPPPASGFRAYAIPRAIVLEKKCTTESAIRTGMI